MKCLWLLEVLVFTLIQAKIALNRIPETNMPPSKRAYHFMDYCETTNQLVIFGGLTTFDLFHNDIWIFDINKSQFFNVVPSTETEPGNT